MIVQYGQKEFDKNWLNLLEFDPVHPHFSKEEKISGNRTVFVYVYDGIPQFMVCVRIGNKLPRNMDEIFGDDSFTSKFDVLYAIFYSIYRLPGATLKGGATTVIKELIAHCKLKGINAFYTLSPLPEMRSFFTSKPNEAKIRQYLDSFGGPVAKFHLKNGAKIHSINFEADLSQHRLEESWGIMVNYDYNWL